MNRTKEEFIARWKCHLAGLALFGVASEVKDGPLLRASKILEVPAQVEKLLAQMFDDLARPSNGHTPLNGTAVRPLNGGKHG